MKKAHLLLIGVGGMALAATIVVLIVIVQPLLFGGAPGISGTVTSRGTALVGGPFSLTDHTGKRVTEKDFLGRHMLIFFGYTYCPDVCPGELQVVAAALDALGDKGKQIQPVFITIDPERDTVQQLADYVPHFHKRLIGLTGTADEIAKAAKAYRVYFAKVEDENASEYLMDHSSILYLMGPKGEFLGHFGYGTQPKELADKLAQYLG